jgi:hypothetical protein
MEDLDVRDGIRALLKWERCQEEQRRLGLEADNLCQWFGDELAALELALRLPTSKSFRTSMISANLTRPNIHVHNSATARSCPSTTD